MSGHSYDQPYNACIEHGRKRSDGSRDGWTESAYFDSLDEVRAAARTRGQTVIFVDKGFATYRDVGDGVTEITRRTTGSVHPRHWDPGYEKEAA